MLIRPRSRLRELGLPLLEDRGGARSGPDACGRRGVSTAPSVPIDPGQRCTASRDTMRIAHLHRRTRPRASRRASRLGNRTSRARPHTAIALATQLGTARACGCAATRKTACTSPPSPAACARNSGRLAHRSPARTRRALRPLRSASRSSLSPMRLRHHLHRKPSTGRMRGQPSTLWLATCGDCSSRNASRSTRLSGYLPKRRERSSNERSARRKSMWRNAGQLVSQK